MKKTIETYDSTSGKLYCAFLRGVNVKGTNMKMAEVCAVFEKAGMKKVSSVLASGNILFSSEQRVTDLKRLLENAMSSHFAYEAFMFLKSQTEIKHIFEHNPFVADPDFHIYVFVGVDGIEQTLLAEFEKSTKTIGEMGQVVAGHFYWKVPKGNTLDSSFGKILGRKQLKDSFTSRNINTFAKVLDKI